MNLEKLLQALSGNPMYRISVTGDTVELIAVTPSMGEAASDVEAEPSESRHLIIIFKIKEGNELEPINAYVEDSRGQRRSVGLDEIRWWLDIIEQTSG
ncbi:MAG: hypothetical protein RXQ79_04290 [Acidilobus sp.]|jgi:hypothetical protein